MKTQHLNPSSDRGDPALSDSDIAHEISAVLYALIIVVFALITCLMAGAALKALLP